MEKVLKWKGIPSGKITLGDDVILVGKYVCRCKLEHLQAQGLVVKGKQSSGDW